jgi:predicted phosphodiesterase
MKVVWFTDIHLDLVDDEGIDALFSSIVAAEPEVVLSGGDVGRSETFPKRLKELAKRLQCPLYFVLGNHDHYGSSFAGAQKAAKRVARKNRNLFWLPDEGVVKLSDETALIGHGLWGDGRAGNARRSSLELADHHLIEELATGDREKLFDTLIARGDEAARWTREHLVEALEQAQRVFFLTHVPPFVGPRRSFDRASSDDELPFYICVAVGEAILEIMASFPDCELTLLSGHRHLALEFDPAPNVHAIAGGARYMAPKIQRIFEIE